MTCSNLKLMHHNKHLIGKVSQDLVNKTLKNMKVLCSTLVADLNICRNLLLKKFRSLVCIMSVLCISSSMKESAV